MLGLALLLIGLVLMLTGYFIVGLVLLVLGVVLAYTGPYSYGYGWHAHRRGPP